MVRKVTAVSTKPDYILEQSFLSKGAVIGVDEVWARPMGWSGDSNCFLINPERIHKLPKTLTVGQKNYQHRKESSSKKNFAQQIMGTYGQPCTVQLMK